MTIKQIARRQSIRQPMRVRFHRSRCGQSTMLGLAITAAVIIGIAGFWYVISSRDAALANQVAENRDIKDAPTAVEITNPDDAETSLAGTKQPETDSGQPVTQEAADQDPPTEIETSTSEPEKDGGVAESQNDDRADAKDVDKEVVGANVANNRFRQPSDAERPEPSPKSAAPRSLDPNETLDLTFDDIKFEMEKGTKFERSMLTKDIEDLNKRKVRIKGFIKPSYSISGITRFVFVRDNQECCFGPGAALYDCVMVILKKGEETDYTVRPVTVEGEFRIKEYIGPDKNIWAIYYMRNGKVK